MYNMIAYVSIPYDISSHLNRGVATNRLGRVLSHLYSKQDRWAYVNALYSVHDNSELTSNIKATSFNNVLFTFVNGLLRSSDKHVVVRLPDWDSSEIVMTECAYAAKLGIETVFLDDLFRNYNG